LICIKKAVFREFAIERFVIGLNIVTEKKVGK